MGVRRYVALLRGINVGGRNRVPMADLREAFMADGFEHVSTYIQSGNVVFSAPTTEGLEERVARLVLSRFGSDVVVVVRSDRQIDDVLESAPPGFGQEPDDWHYDVIFLKDPLTPDRAAATFDPHPEVDRVAPGPGVLYVSRLSARRSQSRLSRITASPDYQLMTLRNWRTTTKLAAMLGPSPGTAS